MSSTSRALHALFDAEWEWTMADRPVYASSLGDQRHAAEWDNVSLAAYARRAAHAREVLAKVEKIPRADLSSEDALSYDLFRHDYAATVEGEPFREYLLPINQRDGIQTSDDAGDGLAFTTAKNYEDWNARLRSFPRYMAQTIELLEEGIHAGITHPKVVMRRVVGQLDKQIVTDPTKSPFYGPYLKDSNVPDRARLAEDAKRAILEAVVPAFERLRQFWVETYLPACKDQVGAWQLPDGEARYAYLVRWHTTTSLTPDEVHAIGLREVGRIRSEIEKVKERIGFKGSLKELYEFLRTDKQFFFKDSADLMEAYRALGHRIDPLLPKLFRRLPKTPYKVQAVPEHIAPDTTTAYYREPAADGSRPGTYFVNLYQPESRPKWEMVALTLHESVPGHHLQIALAMEQENLPQFRRHEGYNAFIEGWALYAESLGDELGLYDDPYAKLGQLTYEMWRAIRLVVDTGIHHLKWDRQRAIDFFMENAAKPELDIVNEIDRYIAWPGQACAYKIGELKIKELRRKQEQALGARFDERAFHDEILRNGPLPLDVLEKSMSEVKR